MTSLAWIAATTVGFVVGGTLLQSPGATGLGQYAFEWDLPAALFGAVLGAVVGGFTGFLQTRTSPLTPSLIRRSLLAFWSDHLTSQGGDSNWP